MNPKSRRAVALFFLALLSSTISLGALARGPQIESLELPVGCALELRVGVWSPSETRTYSFHTATSKPGSTVYEGLPPGVHFDRATGMLRWIPSAGDSGTDYHITVAAFDEADRVLLAMHAVSIHVPAGPGPTPSERASLDHVVGRWKVVDRMAEVPIAPLYVDLHADGRASTELIRYDKARNLAEPDVDRFRYSIEIDPLMPDHGVMHMVDLSGDSQTRLYVYGPNLILEDFLQDRPLTLQRCHDAACQPARVRRCPEPKVAWVAPVPER